MMSAGLTSRWPDRTGCVPGHSGGLLLEGLLIPGLRGSACRFSMGGAAAGRNLSCSL